MTYLGTDDVDATVEKAKKLGATVMMEPFDVAAGAGDPRRSHRSGVRRLQAARVVAKAHRASGWSG